MGYVPAAETVAFLGSLVHRFPVLMPVLQEHLEDQDGEMLSHLLMADVVRWLVGQIAERGAEESELREIVQAIEDQFGQGDPVDELIAASFVESLPSVGEPGEAIRNLLGPRLKAQLQRWEGDGNM